MGGDSPSFTTWAMMLGFNPRPRMGGDCTEHILLSTCSKFQSTPPHGGRPRATCFCQRNGCFNPRPRMGGDVGKPFGGFWLVSFNPRPRMGGDFADYTVFVKLTVSIHAPAWGATWFAVDGDGHDGFNPRPRMGGDHIPVRGR